MQSSWIRHIALAALIVGFGSVGAPPGALAQPDPQCEKTPETCKASVELVRAQERFRVAYLSETGACGKKVACSTGVRPNSVGGRAEILSLHSKIVAQSCETYCDEQFKDNEREREKCRLGCDGKRPILK